MPSGPVLTDVLGKDGATEILPDFQPENPAYADGHFRVAGEIGIHLNGIKDGSQDDGSRIVVSSSGMVFFSRDGKISKATLARRVVSIGAEGRMKSHGAGDVIFIDDDGSILDR